MMLAAESSAAASSRMRVCRTARAWFVVNMITALSAVTMMIGSPTTSRGAASSSVTAGWSALMVRMPVWRERCSCSSQRVSVAP